jgi:hypothetical protein
MSGAECGAVLIQGVMAVRVERGLLRRRSRAGTTSKRCSGANPAGMRRHACGITTTPWPVAGLFDIYVVCVSATRLAGIDGSPAHAHRPVAGRPRWMDSFNYVRQIAA